MILITIFNNKKNAANKIGLNSKMSIEEIKAWNGDNVEEGVEFLKLKNEESDADTEAEEQNENVSYSVAIESVNALIKCNLSFSKAEPMTVFAVFGSKNTFFRKKLEIRDFHIFAKKLNSSNLFNNFGIFPFRNCGDHTIMLYL